MKYNSVLSQNGVSVQNDLSGNPTRIQVANAGVYNLQFAAQTTKVSGGGESIIYIWLAKNGISQQNTTTKIMVSGSSSAAYSVAAWNFVLPLNAGEYVQLYWLTSGPGVNLVAEPSLTINGTTIPETPSIIASLTQVGC